MLCVRIKWMPAPSGPNNSHSLDVLKAFSLFCLNNEEISKVKTFFHLYSYVDFSTQESNNENQDGTSEENTPLTEAEVMLANFWPTVSDEIKRIRTVDAKNQPLPLARIKKIMKLDEDVKMISAEAPLLFAKAAEIFIHELTLRAWVHTENNKRRTLQRNDIAMAITKFDQFDFLIDIVPREEVKPAARKEPSTSTNKSLVNCDQVQYYLQLAQQHQQALQNVNTGVSTTTPALHNTVTTNNQLIPTSIQLQSTPTASPMTINANGTTQNILVTNTGQPITSVTGATVMNTMGGGLQASAQMQPQQQIQLVQQIVTPSGEIQHVPVKII